MNLRIPSNLAAPRRQKPNERLITIDGQTKNLRAWLTHYGLHGSTYHRRRAAGLSVADALQKPKMTKQAAGELAARVRWSKK